MIFLNIGLLVKDDTSFEAIFEIVLDKKRKIMQKWKSQNFQKFFKWFEMIITYDAFYLLRLLRTLIL